MATGVATIVKARLIRLIDIRLKSPTEALKQELFQVPSFSELADAAGLLEVTTAHHIDVEALGDDQRDAWWGDQAHKDGIIRAGYRKAFQLALESQPPKPIVTYWIREVPRFEVVVAETPLEVHVFWLTPKAPPPTPPPAGREFNENMWLVATDQRITDVKALLPTGYQVDPVEDFADINGVQILRLVGY
jgi:hypothetical protein